MKEVKPPNEAENSQELRIFLGGTIDMGHSEDWQKTVVGKLTGEEVLFFNPRRDDWDKSWEQKKENPKFKGQVIWELRHLEEADVILFHFEEESVSMITLLELGLYVRDSKKRVLIHCPDGYMRKGNIDIVLEFYGLSQVETLDEAAIIIKYIARDHAAKNSKSYEGQKF